MNYSLIIKIAIALLLARWKQTTVAAVGVTFSITMFIALLGFMNGLNDLLDGLILNRTPHVRLFNEVSIRQEQPIHQQNEFRNGHNFVNSIKPTNSRQSIYDSKAILASVTEDARVLGVAPKINAQVFFSLGTIDLPGVINGIDPIAEVKLFNFNDYVLDGKAETLQTVSNSIILGKELARKALAEVGDIVQVITPQGERFSLKVVGLFQSGIQEYDKTQSYTSIKTTQKILGKDNNYLTDIQIKLYDMELAPAVAQEYAKRFGTMAEDIQTANSQFETGSFVRTLISYAVGITLLIVAGFGIYNILNMMIYEKMDSIAILKATGFSGRDVNRIFIFIALSIGVTGGLLGLLLGFLASVGIDQIPFRTASLPTIKTYPINYNLIFYVIGFIFSLTTTFLAGLLPANKASGIDPVIIIRGK